MGGETTRDEQGWYSEFAIPLSQIRFKSSAGEQVWGFNVGRIIIHKREETHFVPYPREWAGGGIYRASGFGLLGGLQDLRSRRRLEFVPFVSPQVARDYDGGTPTTWKRGIGADLRVGLTQTLNADLTYRTDFAQVEADQEVVNLTRFNLFFPEKRQFFTEGSATFAFGLNGDEGGAAGVGGAGGDAGLLPLLYTLTIGLSSDGREVPIVEPPVERPPQPRERVRPAARALPHRPQLCAHRGYDWNTLSASYSSDNSQRVYGGGGVDTGGYYNRDKLTLRANMNFLPMEMLLIENNTRATRSAFPARRFTTPTR